MTAAIKQLGWLAIAIEEMRRAWLGWRAGSLFLAFTLFLSGFILLLAANPETNVLSQQTMIAQTIQLSVIAGIGVVLLLGSSAISGERDHSTIETLLLVPIPRQDIIIGKLLAVLSLWLGMMLLAIPYVVLVARGTDVLMASVLTLVIPGTLLVALVAGIAVLISCFSPTNLVSFSVALVVMLFLAGPLLLPAAVTDLPFVKWLIVSDPITSTASYQSAVVAGEPWQDAIGLLLSPIIFLVLVVGIAPRLAGGRLSLHGWTGP